MTHRLLDSHLHLQAECFDSDRQAVMDRAARAGVEVMVCNGSAPDDWQAVADLARADRRLVPCFGLHPWYVHEQAGRGADWLRVLRGYLETTRSGVGEIGLDRWIKDPDVEAQRTAFSAQLQVARDLAVPVTIHCLRAWGLLLDELRAFGPLPGGFMVHAFGGTSEVVKGLLGLGAYVSFAASCLDERHERARQAARTVPADRLLVETDSPDIPPPPGHRLADGKIQEGRHRNEPANLPFVLEGLARLRQESAEALRAQVWENSQRFWGPVL